MLYDPKWEVKTKQPSIEGFVAWLRKQPADKTFEYWDCRKCAVGQYLRTFGSSWDKMFYGPDRDNDLLSSLNDIPTRAYKAAIGSTLTFGQVLAAADTNWR